MKKFAFLIALLLSTAFSTQQSTTRFFFAYEYENLTVDATAGGVAFTASKVSVPSNPVDTAQSVTFTVECSGGGSSCPFRMTLDGTTVTASVGMLADYGASVTIYGLTNIKTFRAIRTGATSAILNTQYFR